MVRAGERGLEGRVQSLEADVRGHERELERLRLLLTSGVEEAIPGLTARGAGASGAGATGGAEHVPRPDLPEVTASGGVWGAPWRGVELPFDLGNLRRWEWWLNKVGIALFLMGVVFLFKFSWDRGWLQVLLTPAVRVGLGILLGTALVGVGLRVYAGRRAFAQVVLGGGIGTYYITGFGAFQMLGVFSYPVAFGFMAAVTLLAFALALRQGGAALAVIGVSGGFTTPFLLYDGAGALAGLVLYAGLVLAGAVGMYVYKGWRSLLVISFAGYWAALLVGYAGTDHAVSLADGVVLQAGVVFGWAPLWLAPAVREALRGANPRRWPMPESGVGGRFIPGRGGILAHLVSFASALISLGLTQLVWEPDRTTMGLLMLGGASLYGLAWAGFRRVGGAGLVAYAQAAGALALSTLSLAFLLEGGALLIALAVEAAALHLASRRLADENVAAVAHALFAFVGVWLLGRLAADAAFPWESRTAVLDPRALADLAVAGLILASSWSPRGRRTVTFYRISAHAALLGWSWRELGMLPGSPEAYVTLAWGLFGYAMFVAGLRRDHPYLIKCGAATLFLVVAKLFLWDLAGLEPVWRVLLFLGFGGLFLVLSYYLRSFWNPGDREEAPDAAPELPERREEPSTSQP